MALTPQRQFIFWGIAFAIFLAFVMVFKSVLLPFVLGIIIAYFLNPVVNWLSQALRVPRTHASLFILCFFVVLAFLVVAVSAPIIYRELSDLVSNMPVYLQKLKVLLEASSRKMQRAIGFSAPTDLETIIDQNMQSATSILAGLLAGIMAGGHILISFVSVTVITPIVAYFIMKEWNKIVFKIRSLLPREYKATIIELLQQIDVKLAGFIRGQLSVAFILGISYSLALSIIGLKYGFLIGIFSGLLSVIPMVGSTVGFLTSITVAWFQTGDPAYTALIAAIFLVGQLVEGNILTPKIVGNSVGLHPLWIFFAVMAGASLAGVLGMLIAVPVAAVASVLCSFAVRKYKQSPYYLEEEVPSNE
ncbi:MAG: AI-2E family transporter [Alphaproteobacteria bacterium]